MDGVRQPKPPWWAKSSLADDLRNKDIFRTYLRNNCNGHLVWGKIATRELWLKCMPHAQASSVRRYAEDLLLCSLLFLHARHYIGSHRIGYVYYHNNSAGLHKAFGRCASLYAMITEFLPYMQQQGADAAECKIMHTYLFSHIKENMLNYLEYTYQNLQENNLLPESVFREMREHAEPDMALRVIMTGLMYLMDNSMRLPLKHIK
jgi:hypothetical protein